MIDVAVAAVLEHYPRIFVACHARRTRDANGNNRLSSHQVVILDHLSVTESSSLTELAECLDVTTSTMSLAVDRLVRSGHVRRSRAPHDRRRLRLLLTQKGRRVRESQSVLDAERVAAILAHLAPGERAGAVKGLALLARAADREVAQRSRARAALERR